MSRPDWVGEIKTEARCRLGSGTQGIESSAVRAGGGWVGESTVGVVVVGCEGRIVGEGSCRLVLST